MKKDLRNAAKSGNKSKVERLRDTINSLEAEENSYAERKDRHERELDTLQERCAQVDRKIFASNSGITHLPTIEDRG